MLYPTTKKEEIAYLEMILQITNRTGLIEAGMKRLNKLRIERSKKLKNKC